MQSASRCVFRQLGRRRLASTVLSLQTIVGAVGLLGACALEDPEFETSEAVSAATVASFITSSCSTSVVLGLATQVANEVSCINPSALTRFSAGNGITFTGNAVLPFLSARAKADLLLVGNVQINSAFRTVPQQFLLLQWFNQGRCGITAAAPVGRSNHESGRALDLANASSRITAMANRGWSHSVPNDPPHFDHLASADIRGRDVLAFQRLWNRNNANDRIAEDGIYGPQTEARLKRSPATGFARGASCSVAVRVELSEVVSVDGPDRVAPGTTAHYRITVANRSETDWPATARLQVAGGAASALYDEATWLSEVEVGEIGAVIPAGGLGTVEIDIAAPEVSEVTVTTVDLVVMDGTAQVASVPLAVTITPNGDEHMSNEADDHSDGEIDGEAPGEVPAAGDEPSEAGCSAGGMTGLAFAPLLLVLRRRRRA